MKLVFPFLALQGNITGAHQVPAVSSVSHTALYTPPPEIPTTVLNIPHPSVISAPLLKSLHSAGPPLLAVSAAPPAQPLAKVINTSDCLGAWEEKVLKKWTRSDPVPHLSTEKRR